ncbi:MAG: hypothetical protein ACFE9R_16585 [Candidatus Hermodarchaeota archaeon]
MNSNLGIFLREIQGTRTLGLGSLKLSLNECKNLLVIDPRIVPNSIMSRAKKITTQLMDLPIPKFGEKTKYTDLQNQLDHLLCVEYLGLSPKILSKIHQTLKFEIEWRLGRTM